MIKQLSFWAVLGVVFITSCARPIANFEITKSNTEVPAKVKLENKSENAVKYEWDFGDGNKSTDESPKHSYLKAGDYEITLIARNKKGKKDNIMSKTFTVEPPKECLVEVETTYGTMIIKLYDETPKHRDNFIKLVEEGFYDDLLFHRVINGFMIQGGDPNSRNAKPNARLGSGGPGYKVDAEFNPKLVHLKGALSAARQGDMVNPKKQSSGSQFYIVQGRPSPDNYLDRVEVSKGFEYTAEQRELYKTQGGTPQLDMDYTVFGMVIEGLDVIDKIAKVRTAPGDRPVEDVVMKMRIITD